MERGDDGGAAAVAAAATPGPALKMLAATAAARSGGLFGRGPFVTGARSAPDAACLSGSNHNSSSISRPQRRRQRVVVATAAAATGSGSGSGPNDTNNTNARRLGLGATVASASLLPSLALWPRPAHAAWPLGTSSSSSTTTSTGGNGNGTGPPPPGGSGGSGGGNGGTNNPSNPALASIPPRDDALPRAPGSRPAQPSPRRRVLIMMSNTGGGHRASAEALACAFGELYGSGPKAPYEVLIADMWADHTPHPFNKVPNSYSFLVKHAFLWMGTYHCLNPRGCHYPYFSAVQALVGASLKEAFDAFDPDLVVSVHPLMQHIPVRVLAARAAGAVRAASEARAGARDAALRLGGPGSAASAALLRDLPPRLSRDDVVVPFATVVTDFTTCHNTWFYPGVDRCFVPTEFAAALARRMGLTRPGQVTVHGLPIRPAFAREARGGALSAGAKARAKARLGLPRGRPAILLIGGGEGMGALEATVRALDASVGARASCAVVCGRNAHLLERLKSSPFPGGLTVVPVGFVDNMHEWMAAADLTITKAGPGTLAEALISGLPILINGNIPCQEEGNIPYIVDNGAGECERDPKKIGAIVARWLSPEGEAAFREMARRSRALGRPEAVFEIARDLAELAEEGAARRRRLREAMEGAARLETEARATGAGKHAYRASCGGGRAVPARS